MTRLAGPAPPPELLAAATRDEAGGVFAPCHRYQQDRGIPVRLVGGAARGARRTA